MSFDLSPRTDQSRSRSRVLMMAASAALIVAVSGVAAVSLSVSSGRSSSGGHSGGTDSVARARIVQQVQQFERDAGGGKVAAVEVVRSTHRHAVGVTMQDLVQGNQPVWVVQLTAASAFHVITTGPPGHAPQPPAKYELWVLDAKTFETMDASVGNQKADLTALGDVTVLTETGSRTTDAPSSGAASSTSGTPSTEASPTAVNSSCPRTDAYPQGTGGIADYVNFVQLHDTQYLQAAYLPGIGNRMSRNSAAARASILGRPIARVNCTIGDITDGGQRKIVGAFRSGNAALLPVGTVIYQAAGYPSTCRIAAVWNDRIYEYAALEKSATRATPVPCALTRPTSSGRTP